ncbi:hypoxanthine phosphoribosyltransferase [Chloroflexota bacterium]
MDADVGLKVCFPRADIEKAVRRLAAEITAEYQQKNPVLIGVLKGAFVFLSDLVRHLDFSLDVDFIRLSSYRQGSESSGSVRILQELTTPIQGRDTLVVEDIVDTGLTTSFLLEYLKKKNPASLRLCTLTDKPSRRQAPVRIDYLGFSVPDKFLVGYGLDLDEKYRNLPDICYLEKT